jgi:hypothetical protein
METPYFRPQAADIFSLLIGLVGQQDSGMAFPLSIYLKGNQKKT